MEYRQLGTSSINASVITFGAWAIGGWMWGGSDRREVPVEAIKNFDADATFNIISNTFSNFKDNAVASSLIIQC